MSRYVCMGKTFLAREPAEKHALEKSRRHPATQIGVFTIDAKASRESGYKRYVTVFLNGKPLPRSAWFAGYK